MIPAAVRSALTSVPGTWRAARSIGDRRFALRVLWGSGLALVLAELRYRSSPRRKNAIRHFVWSAWLAAHWGEEIALALTQEHEEHSLDPLDSVVDQRNNANGRAEGLRDGTRIRSRSTLPAMLRLARRGERRWRNAGLWCVRDGRVEPSVTRE